MNIQQIIIADDDLDDIEVFTEAIKNYNAEIKITYVTDGQKLIDRLNENTIPELIILDLNMPCVGGRDCLETIRSNSQYNNIIIVVHSTSINPEVKDECLFLGANYVVTKPNNYLGITKFAEAIVNGSFDFVV